MASALYLWKLMIEYIYLISGFLGLIVGAEILIRGSVNLAHIFKVSPFIAFLSPSIL